MAGVTARWFALFLTINSQMQVVAELRPGLALLEHVTILSCNFSKAPNLLHTPTLLSSPALAVSRSTELPRRSTLAHQDHYTFLLVLIRTKPRWTTYPAPGTMELGGGTIHNNANEDMGTIPLREAFALPIRLGAAWLHLAGQPGQLCTSLCQNALVRTSPQPIADAKSCR